MATTLIAGAGPVGLTLAMELQRYGVEVRIVDKAPAPSSTSKALVVWSRTLELLDRAECSAAFLERGNRVTAASIWAGKERIGRITFEGVASPYPFALMLPQSDTEQILEAHLCERGVRVERSVELTALSAGPSVTATLRHSDGREEHVEIDWLAGCDGAHSFVRRHLGLSFTGDTLRSDWILADVHLAGVQTPPSELEMIWHQEGVLALFPIAPTRYRVIADVGLAPSERRPDPTLADVQAVIDRRGPDGIVASDPVWLSSFRINERKVANYRAGPVVLAGDAAHIHSPAGGQGMNTGMQDAFNLAWKLALVAGGAAAPEPLLSSYSTERSAVGDQILAATGRLTALAVTKNPVLQSLRNGAARLAFGLSLARDQVAQTLSEISIGYAHGPLCRDSSHARPPHAGTRAPLRSGDLPVGAGTSPRFALFAGTSAAAAALIAEYPNLLEPNVRKPFGSSGLWLVRPDGYVGLAAASDGWDAARTYLNELRSAPLVK